MLPHIVEAANINVTFVGDRVVDDLSRLYLSYVQEQYENATIALSLPMDESDLEQTLDSMRAHFEQELVENVPGSVSDDTVPHHHISYVAQRYAAEFRRFCSVIREGVIVRNWKASDSACAKAESEIGSWLSDDDAVASLNRNLTTFDTRFEATLKRYRTSSSCRGPQAEMHLQRLKSTATRVRRAILESSLPDRLLQWSLGAFFVACVAILVATASDRVGKAMGDENSDGPVVRTFRTLCTLIFASCMLALAAVFVIVGTALAAMRHVPGPFNSVSEILEETAHVLLDTPKLSFGIITSLGVGLSIAVALAGTRRNCRPTQHSRDHRPQVVGEDRPRPSAPAPVLALASATTSSSGVEASLRPVQDQDQDELKGDNMD
jgi:hypothetical protein